MVYPQVYPRPACVIAVGLIYAVHDVQAFGHLAKHRFALVQGVDVVSAGDVERARVQVRSCASAADSAFATVFQLRRYLVVEEPRLVAVEKPVRSRRRGVSGRLGACSQLHALEDAVTALAGAGGVSALYDEVLLHVEEDAVVVVLHPV